MATATLEQVPTATSCRRPLARLRPDGVSLRVLRRWTLVLLGVGLLWRVLRYLLQFPVWGDEAFVCLNLIGQTFAGLAGHLKGGQVAPILFLWGELGALRVLGPSELALRLLPFLAGSAALVLFWRFARLTVSPLAGTFAVGLLAVAIWPVSMCTLIKPYSLDLLAALVLLVPAAHWLQEPGRLRWLALLALAAPVALLASYPAPFVAGTVGLVLLPRVWKAGWRAWALYAGYGVLVLGGFLASYMIGARQLDSGATVKDFLHRYWSEAFPPTAPLALVKWLCLTLTGQMTAYPVGAEKGGSSLTFLLCAVGAWGLWRARRRSLLALCLGPLGLGFLAAVLHRYPFGGSCRLCQYLAPGVCLLGGSGAAVLLERWRRPPVGRGLWVHILCGLLVLVGLGGALHDVVRPYRSQGDLWTRRVVREVFAHAGPKDQVVVLNTPEQLKTSFQWLLQQPGSGVAWYGRVDWQRLEAGKGELWCLSFGEPLQRVGEPVLAALRDHVLAVPDVPPELADGLSCCRRLVLIDRVPYTLVPTDSKGPVERCTLYHWGRPVPGDRPARLNELSCWP
jgi:hypothetical protein